MCSIILLIRRLIGDFKLHLRRPVHPPLHPCSCSWLSTPSATIPTIPARIKRTRQFPFPDTNTLPSILPLLLSILLLLHPTASHSFSLLPLYQKPFFPEHRSLCTSPHSFIHLSKQRLTHDSLVHTHHSQPFYAERDNSRERESTVYV